MPLHDLLRAIVAGDDALVRKMLAKSPALARAAAVEGATRAAARPFFFESILHYVYAGDTALHLAAAGYRARLVPRLVALGADPRAKNRRGAEPLHYAVDGGPGGLHFDPRAQVATIEALLVAGADANAVDKGGVTPLHRAVRNRCAAAVGALIDGGADVGRRNGSGSTALDLARSTTGKSGSGSEAARAAQREIIRILVR